MSQSRLRYLMFLAPCLGLGSCDPGTISSQCPDGVVVNGQCLPTTCEDRTCPPGSVCLGGICQEVACLWVECPPGEGCANGVCYPSACNWRNCPGLGEVCVEEECTPASCIAVQCPAGQVCAAGRCYPKDCPTKVCAGYGEVCIEDECQERSCAGVTCPAGQTCSGGRCYPTECGLENCHGYNEVCVDGVCSERTCANVDCGDLQCANGWCFPADCTESGQDCLDGLEICFEGTCVPRSCAHVTCGADEACAAGACYPLTCGDTPCPSGEVCAGGACELRLCVGVDCATWQRCEAGACCPPETCTPGLQCSTSACGWGNFRCQYDPATQQTVWATEGEDCTDSDGCTQGDVCAQDECRGTPLACNQPPQPECRGDQRVSFRSPGTCVDGSCQYAEVVEDCPEGCTDGQCIGAMCNGIQCSPNEQCVGTECRCGGTGPDCAGDTSSFCCGAVCVDLTQDSQNCGGCDNLCGPNGSCAGQICGCQPGFGDCTLDPGCETTLGSLTFCRDCQESCEDNNPCTDDSCDAQLGCQHAPNTGACDDASACTDSDTCSGGTCQGVPKDCNDLNACTQDDCNPASGQCQHVNDDAAACSDNDGCTTGDHCQGGVCVFTGGSSCDDGNPCTDDGCEPGTGECTHANNTGPCSDSNECTQGDACSGGACQAGAPRTCTDGNDCTDDGCDPATGCTYNPNADACDDADECTINDACSGAACSGAPRNCDDGNPCTTDGCNSASGCTHANNTAPCNDGDACTAGDTCAGGACAGTLIDADGDDHQPPPCGGDCLDDNPNVNPGMPEGPLGAQVCSDGLDNDCDGTTDGADSTCQSCTLPEQCDDGNACNGVEGCNPPNCTSGTALDCDDGNPCTTDSCDQALGCQHVNLANGTECGARVCNALEWRVPTCQAGQCTGNSLLENCADANQCTNDACSAATGCSHPSFPNGTECGSRSCNGLEWRMQTCQSGTCSGTAVAQDCNDGQACTSDACAAASGCTNSAVANGTECGARYCNGLEWRRQTCQSGACTGNALQQNCNDIEDCTSDSCNAASGCTNVAVANGIECGARYCSSLEWRRHTCQSGSCSGSALQQNCNDGQECTSDTCNAASGCSNVAVANGIECGARFCSSLEWRRQTCQSGSCSGSALQQNCNDGQECTSDTCNAASGCSNVAVANGIECGARFCNGLEWRRQTCLSGACSSSALQQNCNDANQCTTDSCAAASGCSNPNASNGTECGSRYCNGLEWRMQSCVSGACSGNALVQNCNDGQQCTNDSCAAASGCTNANVANGTECGARYCIGLAWYAHTCQSGTCSGDMGLQNCNDGIECTSDSCAAASGCTNANVANGTECGSRYCNALEWRRQTCTSGACSSSALIQNCNDSQQCTNDSCAAASGCTNANVANGTECGSRYCSGLEWRRQTCTSGACSSSALIQNCNDANVCSTDYCNGGSGCSYVPNTNPCSDGDACTGANDYCNGAQGEACCHPQFDPNVTPPCNDGNICTYDDCYPATGCAYPAKPGPCDDGDPCTTGDYCSGGNCTGSPLCSYNQICVGGVCQCPAGLEDCDYDQICECDTNYYYCCYDEYYYPGCSGYITCYY